jgi:secreted trypsin-like serine protease
VQAGEYSYLVYLMIDNGLESTYACSAGFLNSRYIVSAGHCSFGNTFQVIIGRTSVRGYKTTDVVNIVKVVRPENYFLNGQFNYNDIAIFELEREVAEVPGVIEYLQVGTNPPPVGAALNLAGFGMLGFQNYTADAHHGIVRVAPDDQCRLYYYRPEVAFCSVDPDVYSCPGDSGSPIVVKQNGKWVLVGIDSFGFGGECGVKLPDGVKAKVSTMIQFIKDNTPLEQGTFVEVADWGELVVTTRAPGSSTPATTTTTTVAPTTTTTVAPTTTEAPVTVPGTPSTAAPETTTTTTTLAPTEAPTTTLLPSSEPPVAAPTGPGLDQTLAPVESTPDATRTSSATTLCLTSLSLVLLLFSL